MRTPGNTTNFKVDITGLEVTPDSGDSNWSNVSLYLPLNSGVSGDLSIQNHEITYYQYATITGKEYISGNASLELKGSGYAKVSGPNYGFDFSNKDFTIEGWFKIPQTGERLALIGDADWRFAVSPTGNIISPTTITLSKIGQVFRESFHGIDYITIEKNGTAVTTFNQTVNVNGSAGSPVFYPYIGDYPDYDASDSRRVTGFGGTVNPSVNLSVSAGDKITILSSHHGKIDSSTWNKIFSGINIIDGGTGYDPMTGLQLRIDGSIPSIEQDYITLLKDYAPSQPNLEFSYYTGDYNSVSKIISPQLNTWYHLAAERSGSSLNLYTGGQLITGQDIGTMVDIGGYSNHNLLIGAEPYSITNNTATGHLSKSEYTGFIDEVRITKGLARYSGQNFTPTGYKTGVGNKNKFLEVELPSSGVVLKNKIKEESLAKAWVTFDGTKGLTEEPPMIKNSYNVRDITDLGNGTYQINFINSLSDSNYILNGSCNLYGGKVTISGKSTTSAKIACRDHNNTLTDPSIIDVIIY